MIRLIVAADQKRGIAKKGIQPWYIPEDEAYFGRQTKLHGAQVLVGSTTFKTFSEPLAERTNYVLTRNTEPVEGAVVVNNLDAFLEDHNNQDLWVIGGAAVFEQVMQSGKADELYVTHIEADFGCDQFFPAYEDAFVLREQSETRQQNGFRFSYAIYDKVEPSAT
ncbi:MAG: dihydrofolate reductase, dihydrofolate reductase [Candidatus Saccharibacteria bacterium]|nr:dihydrofolate reductase, dihydrofolate reductase [Candidatus Saccharibacteria bacterium]